jgi:hypothetical protein
MPSPTLSCTGLRPFGVPVPPEVREHPAEFYVWPGTEPPSGSYGYLCAEHLAQLRGLGRLVFQVTEIASGRVIGPAPTGA